MRLSQTYTIIAKVIVRINDRGPFSEKRIIDLSHSAAKELGLIARGTGQVRIEALHVDHKGQIQVRSKNACQAC